MYYNKCKGMSFMEMRCFSRMYEDYKWWFDSSFITGPKNLRKAVVREKKDMSRGSNGAVNKKVTKR